MTPPVIAVVIPARNAEVTLEDAVNSALKQSVDGEVEICVAVGPSIDRTAEIAHSFADTDSRITVVDNPSGVTSAGLNAAIRATTAPVIARLDAHAEFKSPKYLTNAVETLNSTGAVNVGGLQNPYCQTTFEKAVGAAMVSRLGAGDARYRIGGAPGPVDTVYLGVFRRDALQRVGLFDEKLLRNQDAELNWRLRQAGGTVFFDPNLVVNYRPRSTFRGLASQYFGYGRWRRLVVGINPRALKLRQIIPPLTLFLLLLGLVGGWLWMPLFFLPISYLFVVLAGSTVVGLRYGHLETVVLLLVIFPTIHLSWGLGFLIGIPKRIFNEGSSLGSFVSE